MVGFIDFADAFFAFIHIVASAVWVGGNVFFLVVLRPIARSNPDRGGFLAPIAKRYRELIGFNILAIFLSGVYLMMSQLFTVESDILWVAVLVAKLVLVSWMLYIFWEQRKESKLPKAPLWRKKLSLLLGYDALFALGIVVLLLSTILTRSL